MPLTLTTNTHAHDVALPFSRCTVCEALIEDHNVWLHERWHANLTEAIQAAAAVGPELPEIPELDLSSIQVNERAVIELAERIDVLEGQMEDAVQALARQFDTALAAVNQRLERITTEGGLDEHLQALGEQQTRIIELERQVHELEMEVRPVSMAQVGDRVTDGGVTGTIVECDNCMGQGQVDRGAEPMTCPECDGQGVLHQPDESPEPTWSDPNADPLADINAAIEQAETTGRNRIANTAAETTVTIQADQEAFNRSVDQIRESIVAQLAGDLAETGEITLHAENPASGGQIQVTPLNSDGEPIGDPVTVNATMTVDGTMTNTEPVTISGWRNVRRGMGPNHRWMGNHLVIAQDDGVLTVRGAGANPAYDFAITQDGTVLDMRTGRVLVSSVSGEGVDEPTEVVYHPEADNPTPNESSTP